MSKTTLAKIPALALLVVMLSGCSSSSTTSTTPTKATLITIIGDAPICDAVSVNLTLTGLDFTPSGGGNAAGYLTTTAAYAPSIRVNLQLLRDFDTVLYSYPVKVGNYQQANFKIQLAQLATYEPALTPPVKLLTTTLTNAKPTLTLNPEFVITEGKTNVLQLDFSVLNMLKTDSSGVLTGSVTPVISATQLTSTGGSDFAEFDDLSGFVRSTTLNSAPNSTYVGSLLLQLLSASVSGAPALSVNVKSDTKLEGFVDLAHLLPDSYVEVAASLNNQGEFVGNTVEFQALEQPYTGSGSTATPHTALIGPITSITTDQAGNPTKFNLWVQDAEPQDSSNITLDTIFQVNLNSGTLYKVSTLGPNFANLTFGPQNLAVGQKVVVHGAYTRPSSSTGSGSNLLATVSPSAIYLKLQSLQGTMGSVVTTGSDGLTGAFILKPCCTLLQGAPIYVLTNSDTNYVNLTGPSALTPQMNLVVKGMPFYEPAASTINGVTIPAGTLVVEAKQVHKI